MDDDELAALLRDYGRHTRLRPATEDRILTRLRKSVAQVEQAQTHRSAEVSVRWILLPLAVAAVLAMLWLLPTGWGVERARRDPDEAQHVATPPAGERAVERATSRATIDDVKPAHTPSPDPVPSSTGLGESRTSERADPARPRVRERGDTRGASEDSVRALAAEAALLRQANAALSSGEAERALSLLQAWERRFEPGQLHEEHAALRAIALCTLGRSIQGRGEAEAFAQRHPGSAFADRVSGACSRGGEKKATGPGHAGQ